jgi:hypothetical protein
MSVRAPAASPLILLTIKGLADIINPLRTLEASISIIITRWTSPSRSIFHPACPIFNMRYAHPGAAILYQLASFSLVLDALPNIPQTRVPILTLASDSPGRLHDVESPLQIPRKYSVSAAKYGPLTLGGLRGASMVPILWRLRACKLARRLVDLRQGKRTTCITSHPHLPRSSYH